MKRTSLKLCLLLSTKLSRPLILFVSSTCRKIVSRDTRGLQPNRDSKGAMLFGSVGSGRMRFVQQDGEIFFSYILGHATHSCSTTISSISTFLDGVPYLPRGRFIGFNCMSFHNHRQKRCFTTSQLNSRTSTTLYDARGTKM